jgi:hypothetical protein
VGGLLRELKMNKHFEALLTMLLIIVFFTIFAATILFIGHALIWLIMLILAGPLWAQIVIILAIIILLYNRIYNELG